jgi:hypothetical protein
MIGMLAGLAVAPWAAKKAAPLTFRGANLDMISCSFWDVREEWYFVSPEVLTAQGLKNCLMQARIEAAVRNLGQHIEAEYAKKTA